MGTGVIVGGAMAGLSFFESRRQSSQQNKYIQQQIDAQNQIADLQIAALQEQAGMGGGGGGGGSGGAAAAAMRAAAQRTREIGERNARTIRKEGARTIGQRKKENAEIEGSARANMAASGMKASSGSFAKFEKDLVKEGRSQVEWIQETVDSQAQAAIEGADFEASMAEIQAMGMGGGGGGGGGVPAGVLQAEIDQINAMRGLGEAQLRAGQGGGGGFFGDLLGAAKSGVGGWGLFK